MSNRVTREGTPYRRGTIPKSGLTGAVQAGEGNKYLMARQEFEKHSEEDIAEFLDLAENAFRNPERFTYSIPHEPPVPVPALVSPVEMSCLRKISPQVLPELRRNKNFRYLLRGMPSCGHATESAFILDLRIRTGIELDESQSIVRRTSGDPWRFIFVRADEITEKELDDDDDVQFADLPSDPVNAPYHAPEITKDNPIEEFLHPDTSDDDKDIILGEFSVVFLKVEPATFRVEDWWIEFG